jgi:hypothetical protein
VDVNMADELHEIIRLYFEESGCPLSEEQLTTLEKSHGGRVKPTLDQQAMWDAMTALGQDTDGDATPAATIAGMGGEGYRRMFLDFVTDVRREHDQALDEVCMHERSTRRS